MHDSICAFEEKMSCVNYQVFLFISGQRSLGVEEAAGYRKRGASHFPKIISSGTIQETNLYHLNHCIFLVDLLKKMER